jgi:hypothetical protein
MMRFIIRIAVLLGIALLVTVAVTFLATAIGELLGYPASDLQFFSGWWSCMVFAGLYDRLFARKVGA